MSAEIMILLAILVYFLPVFIAAFRGHGNFVPILLLDVFLGWTFLGWVAALIWASANNTSP